MTERDVLECMKLLNSKKSEGFDRIPVCVIHDACDSLLKPMSALFDNIYKTKHMSRKGP